MLLQVIIIGFISLMNSKMIIVLIIFVALALIPNLVSNLADTIRLKAEGGGHAAKNKNGFVVIVAPGKDDEQLIHFLDQVFHVERFATSVKYYVIFRK